MLLGGDEMVQGAWLDWRTTGPELCLHPLRLANFVDLDTTTTSILGYYSTRKMLEVAYWRKKRPNFLQAPPRSTTNGKATMTVAGRGKTNLKNPVYSDTTAKGLFTMITTLSSQN
jgi:hypothetical protein